MLSRLQSASAVWGWWLPAHSRTALIHSSREANPAEPVGGVACLRKASTMERTASTASVGSPVRSMTFGWSVVVIGFIGSG